MLGLGAVGVLGLSGGAGGIGALGTPRECSGHWWMSGGVGAPSWGVGVSGVHWGLAVSVGNQGPAWV